MSKRLKLVNGIPNGTTDTAVSEGGTGANTAATARLNLGTEPTFNGLEDNSKFTISYSASTRIFSVAYASGAGVWVGGTRFAKSGTEELTAHADTTGKYYFYYNSSGTLVSGTTVWDFFINAQVAIIYYNSTGPKAILMDDRHPAGSGMSDCSHKYNHLTKGTQTVSGMVASGYVPNTAGAAALNYAVSEGVIADEDLFSNINAVAEGGPYRILYRTGSSGVWTWDDTSTTGILDDGTNIYYNQFVTGAWQLTPVTSNSRWVNYYIFVMPEYTATKQIVAVMGQTEYTSVSTAQGEDPSTAISGISSLTDEGVFLYRMTYRRVSGSSPSNAQIVSAIALRSNIISVTGGFNPSVHSSLTGRDAADSHPATAISVVADSFDINLSVSDTTVETALTTLNTHTHQAVTGTRGTPSNIVAGTGVAFSSKLMSSLWFIQGDGGNITVTANPQVAVGTTVGQLLTLIGRNNSATVTLADGNGLSLSSGITLGANHMLRLIWDGTLWMETDRKAASSLSHYDESILVTTEIGVSGTGYDSAHKVFTLPSGKTYNGASSYELKVHTNGVKETVGVTFNYENNIAATTITFIDAIPKNARIDFEIVS